MTVLLVLLGGAAGASLRYLTVVLVTSRWATDFPWGTSTVNAVGCLVAGATAGGVSAMNGPAWVVTLVVTGLCGALTTFSAFGFETILLVEAGSSRAAGLNIALTVVVGLAAAASGWAMAVAIA